MSKTKKNKKRENTGQVKKKVEKKSKRNTKILHKRKPPCVSLSFYPTIP